MIVSKRKKSLDFLNKLTDEISKINNKHIRYNRTPAICVLQVNNDKDSIIEGIAVRRIGEMCGIKVDIVKNELGVTVDNINKYVELITSEKYRRMYDGLYLTRIPDNITTNKQVIYSKIPMEYDLYMNSELNASVILSGIEKNYVYPYWESTNFLLADAGVDMKNKKAVIISKDNVFSLFHLRKIIDMKANVSVVTNMSEDELVYHTLMSDVIITNSNIPYQININHLGLNHHVILDYGKGRYKDIKYVGNVKYKEVAPVCDLVTSSETIVCPLTLYFAFKNMMVTFRENEKRYELQYWKDKELNRKKKT